MKKNMPNFLKNILKFCDLKNKKRSKKPDIKDSDSQNNLSEFKLDDEEKTDDKEKEKNDESKLNDHYVSMLNFFVFIILFLAMFISNLYIWIYLSS